MEIAKVDVRKLQLLNDRINQCIDALNQVRTSVHGLSHASVGAPVGTTAQVAGLADPRIGYGVMPTVPGYGTGLAHTSLPQIPFPGYVTAPGVNGMSTAANQIPFGAWNTPFGLSHTGLTADQAYNRPLWADPLLAARVAQTFPFVQFALPPVVPVY